MILFAHVDGGVKILDEPCGGTLGFLGHWILTDVYVTQARM